MSDKLRAVREMPPGLMVVRSTVLVALLYGSLLPFGQNLQIWAAIAAAPLVCWEIVRAAQGGHIHRAVILTVPLFMALLIPAYFVPAVVDQYGQDKLQDLATLSVFTALAASLIRDKRHLLIFARAWVGFGLLVALLALSGDVGIAGRAVGVGAANPIGLARAITTAAIAAAWLMMQRRLRVVIGIPVLAILVLGLFATGSKGPLLAAIAAVTVMALASSSKRLTRLLQICMGAAALYGAAALIPTLGQTRLGEFILDPTGVQDTVRQRFFTASLQVLEYTRGAPQGYGSWPHVTMVGTVNYPHNIWLELAIEAGWVTLVVVAAITAWVLLQLLFRGSPETQLTMAWLTAEVVTSSLTGDIRARTYWFFLVLGFMSIRLVRERTRNKVSPLAAGADSHTDSGRPNDRADTSM